MHTRRGPLHPQFAKLVLQLFKMFPLHSPAMYMHIHTVYATLHTVGVQHICATTVNNCLVGTVSQ